MKRRGTALALGLLLTLATAHAAAATPGGWQAVKAATARYNSFAEAVRAGYSAVGEPCVESPVGAMGVHAVNVALASDLVIDPLRPEILLYLRDGDGKLRLVGVEYFQAALVNTEIGPAPWFGHDDPRDLGMTFFNPAPSILGQTFDGPMEGHNPSMPWHYDLHAWLWADNPAGTFAMFNPSLSCPA